MCPDDSHRLRVFGDLNGGGVASAVLYGTPVSRPSVLMEASLDGGNGFNWLEENTFYANLGPGDFEGDGVDELTHIDTLINGSGPIRRGADPKALNMFNGPDSIDLRWQAPDDASLSRLIAFWLMVPKLLGSGTLRRCNVVSVNPTDTPRPDTPNDTAPPANLTASVYSATTAVEIFWNTDGLQGELPVRFEVCRMVSQCF